MKKETILRLKQVGMVVFLLMVVIGFTVPVILQSSDETSSSEQKTCQSDADCYLTCDETPIKVICLSNLCQQTSCDVQSSYPYTDNKFDFKLKILINSQPLNLQERVNPSDFFIQASGSNGEQVSVYSSGLYLQQVLEKIGILLTGKCLIIGEISYCDSAEKSLLVKVNNEISYQSDYYSPQANDLIEIIYG